MLKYTKQLKYIFPFKINISSIINKEKVTMHLIKLLRLKIEQ